MQIDQRIDALENSYYIWFLLTTEIVSVGGGGADPENSERGGRDT